MDVLDELPLLIKQLTMNNDKLVGHIATLGCPTKYSRIASVHARPLRGVLQKCHAGRTTSRTYVDDNHRDR